LIYYFADDPYTRSILIYMESIGDARSFLSAAREVALRKPIIVIKARCTEAAAKAVASHTGTLTGNDAVLNAIVVSDRWQGHGLGTHLLKLLLDIGRQEGVEHIVGQVLPDNHAMQHVCKKLGFAMSYDEFPDLVEAKIKL
jgi:GNAT superfamily N-acetyltransferase